MIKKINFHYFYFSTYLVIILISFIISFLIFYKMTKNKYNKIDIFYVFAINILGFGIGSKLLYLIDASKGITPSNFINSGYSFMGGIIGSCFLVFLYCKKYDFNFVNIESYFMVIYPLIYSVSKLACFTNGCCNSIIEYFPLQFLEAVIMFILFYDLYKFHKKNENYLTIARFLISFGVIRLVIDFCRKTRYIRFLKFTLSQLICVVGIIIGIVILTRNSKLSYLDKNKK